MRKNLVFALGIVLFGFLFLQSGAGFLSRNPSAMPDWAQDYIPFIFLFGFLVAPPLLAILALQNRSGLALKLTSVLAVPGSIYLAGGTTYYFFWGLITPACILLAGIVRPARTTLAAILVGVGLAFPVTLALGSLIL